MALKGESVIGVCLEGESYLCFLFFRVWIFWFSPNIRVVFPAFLLPLFIGEEVRGHACHGMYVESEDNCQELVLFFHQCGSWGSKSGCQAGWKVLLSSHLWQAEQEDHKFEVNFDNTRPCLQETTFAEVICILI